ncbi:ABI3, putative isoform 3 [Hibiscus syriacus]|uniref:ABI3, putative isoform 3 n=1 Tax=Hibiscus syriacus TaxID=106335 RepID=A0A6A3AZU2_HIBSY|nr:ABI3, putative isoform 3 [Hibiscus syriacus]
MKGVKQQQQQEMVGEDLHAGGGNEGNRSGFDGLVEEGEIWLDNRQQQDDELLDVNDASIFFADFPPLPDFPCMSPLSAPAPDADEDMERKNHGYHRHHQHQLHGQHDPAALSSTASMEIPLQLDQNAVDDLVDVMETFGYKDLLDNNDFFDPSSVFHHDDTGLEEFQQDHQQQQQLEQGGGIIHREKKGRHTQEHKASDDLAMVFLEWLKSNKESKEAMKQLLKLILEWVQTNHLQRRSFKETTHNLSRQYSNPSPNTNLNCNSILPSESNSCFSQPAWIPQPAYVTDPAAPTLPGFAPAPVVGYMGDPFAIGAPNVTSHHHHPYHPPTDYQMLDSAQTWSSSQFSLASQYNSFADNNLHQAPLQQPSAFPYVNQYPCQYVPGHNNDQRFVRLGSCATKEARKKRMARQRRFAPHHRNHSHNQRKQLQNQSVDQHERLVVNDNCVAAAQANPINWVYWPSVAGALASNPPVLPGDISMVHHVERPAAMQGQTCQQRQVAPPDRRQGWKPEKNLRFLLQKVLKQNVVGNLGRIVLPKKEVETRLPELEARDGISIAMEDIGTWAIDDTRSKSPAARHQIGELKSRKIPEKPACKFSGRCHTSSVAIEEEETKQTGCICKPLP